MKKIISTLIMFTTMSLLSIGASFEFSSIVVNAEETSESIDVTGVRYMFGEKARYDLNYPESTEATNTCDTCGEFEISGAITDISTKRGFPSYGVNGGTLQLTYSYDDSMINATGEQEHLIDDKSKKVNDITLDEDILKGALILQTSRDGEIWYTVPNETEINLFEKKQNSTESFYKTTDTQMVNGSYFRIIIAYMTEKKVGSNKYLFVTTDDKERHKYAEVYSFYAYDTTAVKVGAPEDNNRITLGKTVRCTEYDTYGGVKDITNEDPHSGWTVGSFFVGGYTDSEIDPNTKENVFLKNNGDRISLWFELKQDITQCRGNSDIKIVADNKGYDKEFDVPGGVGRTMDFGKGVLIFRQRNKDNTYSDPQIYTNFLEAGASPDAVTKIDLFEEGDYEVALDYAVKYDKTKLFGKSIVPQTNHYRISFSFEVRNGNTVVYLKDSRTGSDLSNGSITESGFRIDLANSKFLKVNVKREVLKDGFDGLTEDTKFNSSATDGDEFTKEGVYTVTVANQYNKNTTEKRIYVGTDNVIKAYMVTGLSISEIQDQLALGATIEDDGTITPPPMPEPEPELEESEEDVVESVSEDTVASNAIDTSDDKENAEVNSLQKDSDTLSTEEMTADDNGGKYNTVDEDDSQTIKEIKSTDSKLLFVLVSVIAVLAVFIYIKRKALFGNTGNAVTKSKEDSSELDKRNVSVSDDLEDENK